MKSGTFGAALVLTTLLTVVCWSSPVAAEPSHEAAERELPYLRMSLVMNSAFHLVQLPLHAQGQLELTRERAIASFGGGLIYAGAAGLTFSKSRGLQRAGIYTFMATSVLGAGFVGHGLVRCQIRSEPGCSVQYFNALNGFIMANQIVAWTLGVRQIRAQKPSKVEAVARRLMVMSLGDGVLGDGVLIGAAGTF